MPSFRSAVPFLLAAPSLLAAMALTACGGTASGAASSSSPPATQPTVEVGVAGSSFTGVPDSVHPGDLTLAFDNSGTTLHMAAIGALAGGHTAADLTAFLSSPDGQSGPPPWLTLVGGVDELDPGHTGSWSGNLAAGSYVLLSFVPDAQGVPELADGFLAPFTASGDEVHADAPDAGATVTLGPDAALDLSAVPAGTTAITLVNDDAQPRTVDVTSVKPGRTYDDVVAEAQQGNGVPPSLERLGGTVVPPHGRVVVGIEAAAAGTTYVVFDLDHVGEGAIDHETVG